MKKRWIFVLAVMLLWVSCAMADTDLSDKTIASGTVAATDYQYITAPCSGTLKVFQWDVGDHVQKGNTLFEMTTQTVYAPEDGKIVALFAREGDDCTAVMQQYGAVCALEPEKAYRIQANTTGAYNKAKNKELHVGETLYFKATNSDREEGEGRVIAVEGLNYVVEILSGEFDSGTQLYMYRSNSYSQESRVGTGNVVRRDPVMITGAGIIDTLRVSEEKSVKAGDPLFTVLPGDADIGASAKILSDLDGAITALLVSPGQQVWKGEALARIDATDTLEILAEIDEMDLKHLHIGDTLPVTLDIDKDMVYTGTVTEISEVGVQKLNAAYFTVHLAVTSTDLRLGASASVYLPKN